MPDFLLHADAVWIWFTGGAIALIIELLMPDLLPMGLSVSCFIFGIICYGFPDTYSRLEIGHFLIFSTFIIIISYYVVRPFLYKAKSFTVVTKLADTQRDRMIGLTGIATEPFLNGLGRADVNGASWKCHGPNMDIGSRVVVVDILGNSLVVTLFEYQ